jgi:gamma-glutamylcyclotransferase (GGCT)/AIG2-like uncharacterized protein YtfP
MFTVNYKLLSLTILSFIVAGDCTAHCQVYLGRHFYWMNLDELPTIALKERNHLHLIS